MKKSQLIELLSQFEEDEEIFYWNEFGDMPVTAVEKTDEGVVLS